MLCNSLAIDMKADGAVAVVLELYRSYDVVLDPFRPGIGELGACGEP